MQEYELIDLKVSDFEDNFSNKWCEATFKGVSEPVKWVIKDPSTITLNATYWGEIKEMTSKAGKPYNRFYRAKPEDVPQSTQSPSRASSGSSKTLDYEPSTNARWAIGMAYRAYVSVTGSIESAGGDFPFDLIEQHAIELVSMFERVKDGKQSIDSLIKSDVPSGRQKFDEAREKLKNKISDEPPISDDDFTG